MVRLRVSTGGDWARGDSNRHRAVYARGVVRLLWDVRDVLLPPPASGGTGGEGVRGGERELLAGSNATVSAARRRCLWGGRSV